MFQVNGVFVLCMLALMPRKTLPMYNIVTQLVKASFEKLGIDTTWNNHYFMCDFEVSLRKVRLAD